MVWLAPLTKIVGTGSPGFRSRLGAAVLSMYAEPAYRPGYFVDVTLVTGRRESTISVHPLR